jgi:hypothetical protein
MTRRGQRRRVAALAALALVALAVVLAVSVRGADDRAERQAGSDPTEHAGRPDAAGEGYRFPSPETTGVPAGWRPSRTRSTDLTVTSPGTVVQDVRFTDGAKIFVEADDVTIRRVEMQGGYVTNQSNGECSGKNTLVEDTTFEQIPGRFQPSDFPVIGEGNYTARRIEVDGRGEGPRLSSCGPVTLEDSFIKIKGGPSSDACGEGHSDGVQAVGGVGATARNNTIVFTNDCGTSPWFVVHPGPPPNNSGRYTVDRLLVSGGGYAFRQQLPASVTGLRIVDDSWVYGPLAEMDCSVIDPWDAKLVTIDSGYRVERVVRDQPCETGD